MTLPLLVAIILVESNGDCTAVNHASTAAGLMQITLRTLQDINRFSMVQYKPADRFDLQKSLEMYQRYIDHYATKARLCKEPTAEDFARIWHCGFKGRYSDEATEYWEKIKGKMEGKAQ